MTNEVDLVTWYRIRIEAFSLNQNWGMPPEILSKILATAVVFIAKPLIQCGLLDPRIKQRDEAAHYKWMSKRINRAFHDFKKQIADTTRRNEELIESLNRGEH